MAILEAMGHVFVNGIPHEFPAHSDRTLLGFLRFDLGLTGAKPGCGEGQCGACTVLVDNVPMLACQVHLEDIGGSSITTIEGLATGGRLHPVQQALIVERASQCGYCTPGMALRAAALLDTEPDPDHSQIASAMDPSLCRCGCYKRIFSAVRRAAEMQYDEVDAATANLSSQGQTVLERPGRPWDLCKADERRWFEILGDGLVAVWPPETPAAGMWPAKGGAWLHVAPSGLVTAFSGKVDVGQDNRTAFRLLVAEELAVALDDVQVVLGDTDLCPFDMGTFGSRSMPDAGETLRRAAAGARQTLLALAAKRLNIATETLSIRGGGVIGVRDGPDLRYGELVEGTQHLEILMDEVPLTHPTSWALAGSAGPAPLRTDVVTGARRFTSDLDLPGMLHGSILRPPVRGAVLRSADLAAAEKLPDIATVSEGEFVAVAAVDPIAARQAIAAIDAEWDMPPPGADDLVAHLRSHPVNGEGWQGVFEHSIGDVSTALEGATTSLTATYTTAYVAHTPLETRAAVARWEANRLTVWTGTQVPFGVRNQIAEALGIDETEVRVIVPPTGGAFGGKHGAQVAIEAARLAKAVARPVKVHWTRAEEVRWGAVRPMAVIDIRSGLNDVGSITAWDFTNINSGAAGIACPYDIPNQRLRYQPAESPLAQSSYRALAATANHFARESHIDELACCTGFDPLKFRLRHLVDERLVAVVEAAAERFGWPGLARASGMALGLEKGGRVATCVEVCDTDDGAVRVSRIVTAYECGAVVNVDAVLNQIEGATVMALGGALFEGLDVECGQIADASLSHYRVPRFSDVPSIEVVLVDRRDIASAGAGETPMVTVAPAVANAIYAATGRRIRSLPLCP
ncbi:MAG: molybdopterin cofactor-binding domain-containing protein [Acidimicrobiales bacterium]